jgi:electron transfer flavoprotein beta subunit
LVWSPSARKDPARLNSWDGELLAILRAPSAEKGNSAVKIAVCVKQVPDSWAEKRLNPSDSRLDRESVDAVLNDLDEYAIEEALRYVEANGGLDSGAHTITLISMGPDRAAEAIRKGLSMGADDAVHVVDDALAGSDALATSLVLAEAIKAGGYDLVFCGTESTDARMSVVPAMLSERLGWPQLTFAGEVVIDSDAGKVQIKRMTEDGVETMSASMPAVLSVIEKINEPRYPSFKGIMAAKKKPVSTMSLGDLGVDAAAVGASAAWSSVSDFEVAPPRAGGIKVEDGGDGGDQLVAFLADKKLV